LKTGLEKIIMKKTKLKQNQHFKYNPVDI